MPSSERERPGYLLRVLGDGARPPELRSRTRSLLGAGAAAPVAQRVFGRGTEPPDFTYALDARSLAVESPEPPRERLDAAGAEAIAGAAFAAPAEAVRDRRQAEPVPALLGQAERSDMAAPGSGVLVLRSGATREPGQVPIALGGAASVDGAAANTRVVNPSPNLLAAPARAVVLEVPAALRAPGEPAGPVCELPRVTARPVPPAPLRPAQEAGQEPSRVDVAQLPSELRPLVPLLGRLRRASPEQDAPATDGAEAVTPRREPSPPRPASTVQSREVPPPSKRPARIEARHPATVRVPAREPELKTTSAPAPPAVAGNGASATPGLPRAPVVAAPNRGSDARQTLDKLRSTIQALAARAAAPAVSADERAATAREAPLRRIVERVMTTRVVHRAREPQAFWERRFLGRPHMRAFR